MGGDLTCIPEIIGTADFMGAEIYPTCVELEIARTLKQQHDVIRSVLDSVLLGKKCTVFKFEDGKVCKMFMNAFRTILWLIECLVY